jgi:hypothetical protein
MLEDKLEKQNDFFKKITNALIDGTPEHWYSFTLRLTDGNSGMKHSISSNESHNDIVSPSSELFLATREFQLYQASISEELASAEFKDWLNDDDACPLCQDRCHS